MGPLVNNMYDLERGFRSDFFTSSFRLDSPVTYILSTLSYCTNIDVGPEQKHFAGGLVNVRN